MCGNWVFLMSISYSSVIAVPPKLPDSSTAKYWLLLGAGQVSWWNFSHQVCSAHCPVPEVLIMFLSSSKMWFCELWKFPEVS